MYPCRIGFGYDVHQLTEGLPLIIGGVKISHYKGALGHSDADALLHAICDALLGASGMRDIGFHFPDSDPALKGIDSRILLKKTMALIEEKGWKVGNIDCTVALQKPKIAPYINEMETQITQLVGSETGTISVKATTTEFLGFTGREEGVQAWAVVLLYR
ncbi:MAG: 2-C-methyl-D-erythritol 2,4-cyclodiphosphate synthase [Bacteroidales bacterium]|nr:2-C-methyl-D-erythritol 2,4-cyclodiphosphate synthase [Bacteroidales bacterium]